MPRLAQQGYDPVLNPAVQEGLTRSLETGGWKRAAVPSMVLIWDSRNPAHRSALRRLEADLRFVCAARLFNCFRVDSRSLGARASEQVSLSAWTREGRKVDEVAGSDRLRGAYQLLREAVTQDRKQQLRRLLPKVQEALSAIAHSEAHLRHLQHDLIDSSSGQLNHRIQERILKTRAIWIGWMRALEGLRSARG